MCARVQRCSIITHGPRTRELRNKWSFAYLAKASGAGRDFTIRVSAAGANRFLYAAGMQHRNAFGSFYHVKEFETKTMLASVREFAHLAAQWETRVPWLDASVMSGAAALLPESRRKAAAQSLTSSGAHARDEGVGVLGSNGGVASAARGGLGATRSQQVRARGESGSAPTCLPRVGDGPLRQDMEEGVDWALMRSMLRAHGFGSVERVRLCCGVRNSLRPCHYETEEGFVLQVRGRQRVLLFPPAAAFDGLYTYPAAHAYDKHAMVDLEAPDEVRFRKAGLLCNGVVAILEPGDLLYVPAYWHRHVQLLESENACLLVSVGTGHRTRAEGAERVSAARAAEERVEALEGQAASKAFLERVAAGDEASHFDTRSVRGVQRIQLATQVRDEVDAQCGRGAWATVLPQIVEGRLERTPWLDSSITNPLLIADKVRVARATEAPRTCSPACTTHARDHRPIETQTDTPLRDMHRALKSMPQPYYVPDTRTEEQLRFPELYAHSATGKVERPEETPKAEFGDHGPDF